VTSDGPSRSFASRRSERFARCDSGVVARSVLSWEFSVQLGHVPGSPDGLPSARRATARIHPDRAHRASMHLRSRADSALRAFGLFLIATRLGPFRASPWMRGRVARRLIPHGCLSCWMRATHAHTSSRDFTHVSMSALAGRPCQPPRTTTEPPTTSPSLFSFRGGASCRRQSCGLVALRAYSDSDGPGHGLTARSICRSFSIDFPDGQRPRAVLTTSLPLASGCGADARTARRVLRAASPSAFSALAGRHGRPLLRVGPRCCAVRAPGPRNVSAHQRARAPGTSLLRTARTSVTRAPPATPS
jgi:hypothetical protein